MPRQCARWGLRPEPQGPLGPGGQTGPAAAASRYFFARQRSKSEFFAANQQFRPQFSAPGGGFRWRHLAWGAESPPPAGRFPVPAWGPAACTASRCSRSAERPQCGAACGTLLSLAAGRPALNWPPWGAPPAAPASPADRRCARRWRQRSRRQGRHNSPWHPHTPRCHGPPRRWCTAVARSAVWRKTGPDCGWAPPARRGETWGQCNPART